MASDYSNQSGYNLTVDDVLALVEERLQNLGVQLQPGGDTELPGFDPNYKTNSVRLPTDVASDSTSDDGETKQPIGAGETVHFDFQLHNQVDTDKAYGVMVKVPDTPSDGAFVITGPAKDGADLTIHGTKEDFNTSIGRFFSGLLHVRGTVEGSANTGQISIVYGDPQDQTDLPSGGGDISISDPDVITGTDSLHVDDSGVYIVTVTTTVTIDTDSATLGGVAGSGYVTTDPSIGPNDVITILGTPTSIIE